MQLRARVAAVLMTFAVLGGCGGDSDDPDDGAEKQPPGETTESTETTEPAGECPEPTPPGPQEYDAELHDELVAMLERDQSGRTGGADEEGDEARTARLKEIIAEHGWPGFDLVGEDGEDAAWAIAQHSDLDPEFQSCALAHLEVAVDAGQGSPGNLAYLTDRIAVAAGEPQTYGTQVGCARSGKPKPATPLVEPDRIDELRAEVGLEPFEDYLAEMKQICGG